MWQPEPDALLPGSVTRYFGKICARHPELRGERHVCNRACVACAREKLKARRAKLKARRPPRKRKPTPRQIAARAGEQHFIARKPCKRGHHSPRLVSTGSCLECKRIILKRLYDKRSLAVATLHELFDGGADATPRDS